MFNYLLDAGGMLFRGPAITVLVEALLAGGNADFQEAQDAIGRLEAARTEPRLVPRTADAAVARFLARAQASPQLTHAFGIATAIWRDRSASTGISLGPRRWHNVGRPGRRSPRCLETDHI